jgi:hypothetical protein
VIGVRVTDAMGADALHQASIIAPQSLPLSHVVGRGIVDGAEFSFAEAVVVSTEAFEVAGLLLLGLDHCRVLLRTE